MAGIGFWPTAVSKTNSRVKSFCALWYWAVISLLAEKPIAQHRDTDWGTTGLGWPLIFWCAKRFAVPLRWPYKMIKIRNTFHQMALCFPLTNTWSMASIKRKCQNGNNHRDNYCDASQQKIGLVMSIMLGLFCASLIKLFINNKKWDLYSPLSASYFGPGSIIFTSAKNILYIILMGFTCYSQPAEYLVTDVNPRIVLHRDALSQLFF